MTTVLSLSVSSFIYGCLHLLHPSPLLYWCVSIFSMSMTLQVARSSTIRYFGTVQVTCELLFFSPFIFFFIFCPFLSLNSLLFMFRCFLYLWNQRCLCSKVARNGGAENRINIGTDERKAFVHLCMCTCDWCPMSAERQEKMDVTGCSGNWNKLWVSAGFPSLSSSLSLTHVFFTSQVNFRWFFPHQVDEEQDRAAVLWFFCVMQLKYTWFCKTQWRTALFIADRLWLTSQQTKFAIQKAIINTDCRHLYSFIEIILMPLELIRWIT